MLRISGGSLIYPWELKVRFSDADKLFLEDLAFIHGGVGISTMVRELVRAKQKELEEEIHDIPNADTGGQPRRNGEVQEGTISDHGNLRPDHPG